MAGPALKSSPFLWGLAIANSAQHQVLCQGGNPFGGGFGGPETVARIMHEENVNSQSHTVWPVDAWLLYPRTAVKKKYP